MRLTFEERCEAWELTKERHHIIVPEDGDPLKGVAWSLHLVRTVTYFDKSELYANWIREMQATYGGL